VLDLGSGSGSFELRDQVNLLVRVDLSPPPKATERFVQADAHLLPFGRCTFDVAIAAHCLEHFDEPERVLCQIAGVLRNPGLLFISVPDSSTFTDRLYRWVYDGGGHVNRFDNLDSLVAMVQITTGLRLVGARRLHSSFQFLTGTSILGRRRRYLFFWAYPFAISAAVLLISAVQRLLHRSVLEYGWELYFSADADEMVLTEDQDVCCACGSGHSDAWLTFDHRVTRLFPGVSVFRCPSCRQLNLRRWRVNLITASGNAPSRH
jgi:SAM-dependent methyltransferase